jgi:hypothetical protein
MNSGSSTIAFVVAVVLAWFGFASRKPEAMPERGVTSGKVYQVQATGVALRKPAAG